jgi:hypothetical protein
MSSAGFSTGGGGGGVGGAGGGVGGGVGCSVTFVGGFGFLPQDVETSITPTIAVRTITTELKWRVRRLVQRIMNFSPFLESPTAS